MRARRCAPHLSSVHSEYACSCYKTIGCQLAVASLRACGCQGERCDLHGATWPWHTYVYETMRPEEPKKVLFWMRQEEEEKQCAVVSAKDGRWRVVSCKARPGTPAACRKADGSWHLPLGAVQQGSGARTLNPKCTEGSAWDVPHHAKENLALWAALVTAGVPAARLPLQGEGLRVTLEAVRLVQHCTGAHD